LASKRDLELGDLKATSNKLGYTNGVNADAAKQKEVADARNKKVAIRRAAKQKEVADARNKKVAVAKALNMPRTGRSYTSGRLKRHPRCTGSALRPPARLRGGLFGGGGGGVGWGRRWVWRQWFKRGDLYTASGPFVRSIWSAGQSAIPKDLISMRESVSEPAVGLRSWQDLRADDWAGASIRGCKDFADAREQLLSSIGKLSVQLEGDSESDGVDRDPGSPLPLLALTEEDKAEVLEYRAARSEEKFQAERKEKSDVLELEKRRLSKGSEEKRVQAQIMKQREKLPEMSKEEKCKLEKGRARQQITLTRRLDKAGEVQQEEKGKYRELKVLGSGSFGTVMLVRQTFAQAQGVKSQHTLFALKLVPLFPITGSSNAPAEGKKKGKQPLSSTTSPLQMLAEVMREVRLLAQCRHPCIVRFSEVFLRSAQPTRVRRSRRRKGRRQQSTVSDDTDAVCIVMEYCEHGDLGKVIAKLKASTVGQLDHALECIHNPPPPMHTPLGTTGIEEKGWPQDPPQVARERIPEHVVLQITVQLLLALQYLHASSPPVLHRDVKPANVFLCTPALPTTKGRGKGRRGSGGAGGNPMVRVKLGDLGFARVLEHTTSMALTCAGSPHYMSPEVINNGTHTQSTDIWSLGCTLYELMTLELPFKGRSLMDQAKKVVSDSPRLLQAYAETAAYPGLAAKNKKKRTSVADAAAAANGGGMGQESAAMGAAMGAAGGAAGAVGETGYSVALEKLVASMLQKDPKQRPTEVELLQAGCVEAAQAKTAKEGVLVSVLEEYAGMLRAFEQAPSTEEAKAGDAGGADGEKLGKGGGSKGVAEQGAGAGKKSVGKRVKEKGYKQLEEVEELKGQLRLVQDLATRVKADLASVAVSNGGREWTKTSPVKRERRRSSKSGGAATGGATEEGAAEGETEAEAVQTEEPQAADVVDAGDAPNQDAERTILPPLITASLMLHRLERAAEEADEMHQIAAECMKRVQRSLAASEKATGEARQALGCA
jgi:serine/threonine protein kinase